VTVDDGGACRFPRFLNLEHEKQVAYVCLRLALRLNMIARSNPVRAPISAPVIEMLFNDWVPLPAHRKPPYAIARVQRIMRTLIEFTSRWGL
jgi:hypothetical protein